MATRNVVRKMLYFGKYIVGSLSVPVAVLGWVFQMSRLRQVTRHVILYGIGNENLSCFTRFKLVLCFVNGSSLAVYIPSISHNRCKLKYQYKNQHELQKFKPCSFNIIWPCTSNEHSTNVLDSKVTVRLIILESRSEHHS